MHLRVVRDVMRRYLRVRAVQRGVTGSALAEYLHVDMALEKTEQLRVIFVNARLRIIEDEIMWAGSLDSAPMYPREVVRRAMELGAAGLVVVHNHPSGDPTPSPRDVSVTRELIDAAAVLGIMVHDHLIVSDGGRFSMRKAKLI